METQQEDLLVHFSDCVILYEYKKRDFDETEYEEKPDNYIDDVVRKICDFPTEALLHALKFRGIKRYENKNNDKRMIEDYGDICLPDDKYGLMVSDRYDRHLDDYFEDANDYLYLVQLYTPNVPDEDYTYFKITPFTEESNDTFDKIKRCKQSKFCSGCEDVMMDIKFTDRETFLNRVRKLL